MMSHTQKHHIPAAYLILIKDEKILLLRRFHTGYADGEYSLIAGHLEPHETLTQCIIREAQEEAGIVLDPEHLQVVHVMHRDSGNTHNNERIDVFFKATIWDGIPENKEPHKCDDVSWFELSHLPENTIPYIQYAIDQMNKKSFYSEYGWRNKSAFSLQCNHLIFILSSFPLARFFESVERHHR